MWASSFNKTKREKSVRVGKIQGVKIRGERSVQEVLD